MNLDTEGDSDSGNSSNFVHKKQYKSRAGPHMDGVPSPSKTTKDLLAKFQSRVSSLMLANSAAQAKRKNKKFNDFQMRLFNQADRVKTLVESIDD